jgi:hypothetical protein
LKAGGPALGRCGYSGWIGSTVKWMEIKARSITLVAV